MLDRRAYRRHLPHYQNANRIYLVTFVTAGRWVLPPIARDIVIDEIHLLDDLAFIHVAVVMPDHVHIVMQPLWDENGVTYALPINSKARKRAIIESDQSSVEETRNGLA
jgi:hypothetical protein